MQEIKCPNCGQVFQVDETGYAQIVQQIRDKEFEMELDRREAELAEKKNNDLRMLRMEQEQILKDTVSDKEAELTKQKNETERIEAWYYYRYKTARDTRDRAQVHAIKKEIRRDYRLAVVLPFDQLAEKYPSLKKHRQLYPFCVLHRIFTRGLSRLFHRDWRDERSEADYNNLSQGAKDKIELFKTLGLMSK